MVKFYFLHQLNNKQIDNLIDIVSDKDNMKNIGNGKPLDKNKVYELINYDKDDYKDNYKKSNYIHIVITYYNKIVGFGKIHPTFFNLGQFKPINLIKNKYNYQVGLMIDKNYRNKGLGKQLLNKLIEIQKEYKNNNKICGIVNINNKNSNLLFKHYNKEKCNFIFRDNEYFIYELN